MNKDDIKKHEEFWTKGVVYCPNIPEPFKNWTKEQFEKEIKRLGTD